MNTLPSVLEPKTQLVGGFQAYLNYVYSIPCLSQEEEETLFNKIQNENDLKAARKVILAHLKLVAFIAKSYVGYGIPLEDLVQEGSVGLMKSVKRFDLSYGVRLAAYATHWIKAEICEYVIKNWKLVKIATTKAQRKLFFNLRSSKKRFNWLTENEKRELAKQLNVSKKEVEQMDMRLYQHDCLFEDDCAEGSHHHLEQGEVKLEVLEDDRANPELIHEQTHDISRFRSQLREFIDQLDNRKRYIIENRWLCDRSEQKTLQQLGETFGISLERVRQIEKQVLKDMKNFLAARRLEGTSSF